MWPACQPFAYNKWLAQTDTCTADCTGPLSIEYVQWLIHLGKTACFDAIQHCWCCLDQPLQQAKSFHTLRAFMATLPADDELMMYCGDASYVQHVTPKHGLNNLTRSAVASIGCIPVRSIYIALNCRLWWWYWSTELLLNTSRKCSHKGTSCIAAEHAWLWLVTWETWNLDMFVVAGTTPTRQASHMQSTHSCAGQA
jgi:hypothetical protein